MGSAIEMILAMAAVVSTWLLLAASLVGLGIAGRAVLRPGVRADPPGELVAEVTVLFWIGYALTAFVLQIWHFFLPIGGPISGLLFAAGLIGLVAFGRSVVKRSVAALRARPFACLSLGGVVLWAALHALGPGNAHDSGTYHYALIQWLGRDAIVPGLGNLAVTFAHNSAHLLLAAALDVGPWDGRSEHVLNGLLVLAMAPLAIRGLTRTSRDGHWLSWYDALLIVPIVGVILAKDICSPKTDAAPAFLILLMVRQLLVLLDRDGIREAGARGWLTVQLATLGATAIIVKLSAAPFVVATTVTVAVLWQLDRTPAPARRRTALFCMGIGVVLVGPWLARNVALSGYPLFPKRVAAVQRDWTVPPDRLDAFDFDVQSKATLPRLGYRAMDKLLAVPDGLRFELQRSDLVTAFNWIPGWLVTLPAHSPVAVVAPLLLALSSALLVALRRPRVTIARAPLVALLPILAALVFWFVTAPDPRYGIGLTWSFASLVTAFAVGRRSVPGSTMRRVALVVAVTIGLGAVVGWGVVGAHLRGGTGSPLFATLLERPGPDRGFHPRPLVDTTTWESRYGVVVRRPVVGRRIWATEQPAVGWPAPPDGLAYRDAGNPSAGFRIVDRESSPGNAGR